VPNLTTARTVAESVKRERDQLVARDLNAAHTFAQFGNAIAEVLGHDELQVDLDDPETAAIVLLAVNEAVALAAILTESAGQPAGGPHASAAMSSVLIGLVERAAATLQALPEVEKAE
jgi:hypothetical protein